MSLGCYTHLTPLLLCCCCYYIFGGHCCTAVATVSSLLATSILGFSFRRKLSCCEAVESPTATHQNCTGEKADYLEVCFSFHLFCFCSLSTSEKFVWWASCDCGIGLSILEALQPSHRSSPQFVSVLYNLSPSTSATLGQDESHTVLMSLREGTLPH